MSAASGAVMHKAAREISEAHAMRLRAGALREWIDGSHDRERALYAEITREMERRNRFSAELRVLECTIRLKMDSENAF